MENGIDYNKWYYTMFAVFFFGQGLWLSLIRILEPKYAETVYFNLKIRCCCGRIEKKIEVDEEDHWAPIEKLAEDVALGTILDGVKENVNES